MAASSRACCFVTVLYTSAEWKSEAVMVPRLVTCTLQGTDHVLLLAVHRSTENTADLQARRGAPFYRHLEINKELVR